MLTVERAAIKDHDGKVYTVPRPGRHHDVIKMMVNSYFRPIPITGEQGFVLSDGTFADRVRAREVAEAANQLLSRASTGKELFSEDVWEGFLV
jgi:hypothetical protein